MKPLGDRLRSGWFRKYRAWKSSFRPFEMPPTLPHMTVGASGHRIVCRCSEDSKNILDPPLERFHWQRMLSFRMVRSLVLALSHVRIQHFHRPSGLSAPLLTSSSLGKFAVFAQHHCSCGIVRPRSAPFLLSDIPSRLCSGMLSECPNGVRYIGGFIFDST